MEPVGFVGLGNLGAKLAASLLRAGYPLSVHDLDRSAASSLLDAGAAWAETPRARASLPSGSIRLIAAAVFCGR